MAQRVGMTAVRRALAGPPSKASFFTQNMIKASLASHLPATQTRPVATQPLTDSSAHEVLASQRLRRPVSPHLGVYKVGQTWFSASAWQRITGATLSGSLYLFAVAYLAAPLAGWHLESASLAAAAATLPVAVKGGIKFLAAWPFVYHSLNGVRHLLFDTGYGFAKAGIVRVGWVFWGASVVGAIGCVAFI